MCINIMLKKSFRSCTSHTVIKMLSCCGCWKLHLTVYVRATFKPAVAFVVPSQLQSFATAFNCFSSQLTNAPVLVCRVVWTTFGWKGSTFRFRPPSTALSGARPPWRATCSATVRPTTPAPTSSAPTRSSASTSGWSTSARKYSSELTLLT